VAKLLKDQSEPEFLEMFRREEDEEKEEKETTFIRCCNKGIIRNSSKLRFYWDIYIILLVIYNTFSVPFDAAFGNPNNPVVSLHWINIIIDFCFCTDVLITFRTTYFDAEGEEVTDGRKIARHYVKSGRFFVDFIASMPIDTILASFLGNQSYLDFISLIKLVRVSRINRLISLTKLKTEFKIFAA